jgi:hypothetical protein
MAYMEAESLGPDVSGRSDSSRHRPASPLSFEAWAEDNELIATQTGYIEPLMEQVGPFLVASTSFWEKDVLEKLYVLYLWKYHKMDLLDEPSSV